MNSKERVKSIDFLKGIAILLVVLGHAIQSISNEPYSDKLFNYIYSFHMPLFMFLSGFVSYKVVCHWSDIKKRAYQLLVPFFVYPVVAGLLLAGEFKISSWINIIQRPDGGLWFFYILFFISAFFTTVNVLSDRVITRGGGG